MIIKELSIIKGLPGLIQISYARLPEIVFR
jgi:hypothetical protein